MASQRQIRRDSDSAETGTILLAQKPHRDRNAEFVRCGPDKPRLGVRGFRRLRAGGFIHHEKLLNQTTGILPCSTREYEDTFPCRVLLFPCTSLKNKKVVSTRESEIYLANSTGIFSCIDTTLVYSRVGTSFGIFPCRDQIQVMSLHGKVKFIQQIPREFSRVETPFVPVPGWGPLAREREPLKFGRVVRN
jgi:uncharacterized protein YjhX (UPF0386 family)